MKILLVIYNEKELIGFRVNFINGHIRHFVFFN